MKTRIKIVAGITLVLGIVSIALLATPIQAYVNAAGNGDLLRTQDQDGLRIRDCECDRSMLQVRDRVRERLRTQDCNGTCNSLQEHSQVWQRSNECSMNGVCNCTGSLEQHRYRCRERHQTP